MRPAARLLLLDATRYHNQIVKDQTDRAPRTSHRNRSNRLWRLHHLPNNRGERRTNLPPATCRGQAKMRPQITRFLAPSRRFSAHRHDGPEIKRETPNLPLYGLLVKGPFFTKSTLFLHQRGNSSTVYIGAAIGSSEPSHARGAASTPLASRWGIHRQIKKFIGDSNGVK
jgi:hypothetical protein